MIMTEQKAQSTQPNSTNNTSSLSPSVIHPNSIPTPLIHLSNYEHPLNKVLLDLYSDYIISSFSLTTATGMSDVLDNAISHDSITRFLSERDYTNKDLWRLVKPTVRSVETDDGVIVLDDTIEEKPYTDENEIIAWHFDHTFGRNVKGINIVNCVYYNECGTIPLGMEIVKKDILFTDPITEKLRRQSSITKNEIARSLIKTTIANQVKWKYALTDSWS